MKVSYWSSKMKFKIVLLIVSIFTGQISSAFDGEKCLHIMGQGYGWGMVVSATSFVSSTGDCSAIAMNNEERAQSFYAFNHEKVLEDVAKGGGEYYSSMSRLWDCNDKLNIQSARKNYSTLVKQDINQQYKTLKTVSGCRL